ncbi:MAG: GC-type dockerin domain-anchored protein [Phycisphaerales bacterium]
MMNKERIQIRVGMVIAIAAQVASGDILILDQSEFAEATSGQTMYVDSLEQYPPGLLAAELVLSNGIAFSGDAPFILSGAVTGNVLINNSTPIDALRAFSGFAPDATAMSIRLYLEAQDEYDVTIRTVGGDELILQEWDDNDFDGFFGVVVTNDSLAEVSFRVVGGPSGPGGGGGGIGNYAFDDIAVNAIGSSCPADLTGDGALDFFDISAFLGAYTAMDPAADFTGDGSFSFFDVSLFLGEFSAGCP